MSRFYFRLMFALSLILVRTTGACQTSTPASGEITVQLIQGLDSAANSSGTSEGRIIKSTSAALSIGSRVLLGVVADSPNDGFIVKLLRLEVGGKLVPAASSDVVAAPDFYNRAQEKLRARGLPPDAVKGAHVFLPEKMIVRFTLAPLHEAEDPAHRTLPNGIASRHDAPSAMAGWKLTKTAMGPEAILRGEYDAEGKHGPALLAIGCTTATSYTSGINANSLIMQLRLSKSAVNFDYSNIVMEGGSDNDFARSQLGSQPEIHIDVSADQVGDAPIAPFDLGYEVPDKRKVIDATDTSLKLTIWPPDKPQPQMSVTFKLPADASAMQAMAHPCLVALEQQAAKIDADNKLSTVLECPVVEGKSLVSTKILVGTSRKELEMDADSEATGWALPKATKAHVRPKLVAVCQYGEPGNSSQKKTIEVTRELAIPARADYCQRSHKTTGDIETFSCTKTVAVSSDTPRH